MGYFVRGTEYETVAAAAAAIPVAPAVVSARHIKQNETKQQALDHFTQREDKRRALSGIKYIVREVEYSNLKEAMAAIPVSDSAFRRYLREHNCTHQKALNYFVTEASRFVFNVRGKKAETLQEACELVPCSTETIRRYCKRYGKTQQEAVEYYVELKDAGVPYRVKRYRRCVICGRCLLLTKEEAIVFVHSDEFCLSHEVPYDEEQRSGNLELGTWSG